MPAEGATLGRGDSVSVVDSVKAASDVYSPVSGKVSGIYAALADSPELVNSAAEGDGWLWRMTLSDATELEALMDEPTYRAFVESL